jgi:MFS family permease
MTAAAIGDRFGRRRVFAAGLGVFAAGSAGCALAPGAGALIAARAVQGAGAAMVMPLALALLNAAVPPQRRGWAMGIFGAVTALAAAVGPVLGGAVTQGIAWQWIFWLNVPVALLAIPLVLGRLAESYGPRAPLDLPGLRRRPSPSPAGSGAPARRCCRCGCCPSAASPRGTPRSSS